MWLVATTLGSTDTEHFHRRKKVLFALVRALSSGFGVPDAVLVLNFILFHLYGGKIGGILHTFESEPL